MLCSLFDVIGHRALKEELVLQDPRAGILAPPSCKLHPTIDRELTRVEHSVERKRTGGGTAKSRQWEIECRDK